MADPVRSIVRRFPGVPTLEGAGVRLRRSFSNPEVPLFDPFLLLDRFGSANPFDFMELQDVQELTNFFERTVSAYRVGVEGAVAFDEEF